MYPSNTNVHSPRSSAPSSEFSELYAPPPPQPPPQPPPPLLQPHQFGQYQPQFIQYPQYHSQYSTGLPVQSTIRVPWSTGLCDCWLDVPNCCLTCWCPCITFGQIAEIVDKGSSSCGVNGALYGLINLMTGCGCLYSCVYRSKMRRQFILRETPCHDFLVHCCCEPCALCQEYRELQNRGFDVSIGWEGNAERHSHGVAMPPVIQGAMTR